MKILFLTHYYLPEGNAPASRVSSLAERWVAAGHEVTVITSAPNVPNGIVYPGYRNRWCQTETIHGVKVVRVWTYIAANKGIFLRICNYVSYMFSAFWRGLRLLKPDIMIATSPQFFCGWAGVLLHIFKRIPFLLEIRDIWPESIISVGGKMPAPLYKLLYWMDGYMCNSANHIVTVGQGYALKLMEKNIPADKISIIMNGVDKKLFFPHGRNEQLLSRYNLTGKFICSYIGTVGMACGLHIAVEAAEILKKRNLNNIHIVIVGDGACRKELEESVAQRKLDNIVFIGCRPKAEIPDWVASSDINLVHLKKTKLFTTVMPSKIFESSGCARPILMGVDGLAKKLVMDANAGVSIEPENAEQLADALEKLSKDPALCETLGQNAYKNIASKYDRDVQASDYLKILESVLNR